MGRTNDSNENNANPSKLILSFLPLATALVYYFSNPKPQNYYDYTFRVAGNLLHGSTGFAEKPPAWLNEFVPLEGFYYSVFPLGAVLTMIPFALLRSIGVVTEMPGAFIAAFLAGVICFYLLRIAEKYEYAPGKKVLLILAILFGTWMWTNLTFAGAWQLALGFAMVGEVGAIYYSAFDRRPLIAGAFFALAFGNRTEVLLTAPVFFYLLNRGSAETRSEESNKREKKNDAESPQTDSNGFLTSPRLRVSAATIRRTGAFCSVPFVLGLLTLTYNYVRFHSITDFGYARIPGVLNEPWYDHGIFSIEYIPRQAWEMLWKMWQFKDKFPYFMPDGFSSSILWSGPFLLFLLRFGSRDKELKYASWAAIVILTFLLWIHGNSGGWQFGYRYAMVLLPWAFVILLESSPKKIAPLEWVAYCFSFAMNIYATWLFHWTEYLRQ
jgi:hypothetical protein